MIYKIVPLKPPTDKPINALLLASRQLEMQGYCPYSANSDIHQQYATCHRNKTKKLYVCHCCIYEYFENEFSKIIGQKQPPDKIAVFA